ncbi:MAG TPA: anthranilate synthase component I, partial [Symbiobacteriaceae bacterium]|nr:anthranilate synthase component I [Symbiobacteriaceae bacterium]
MYQPSLGTYKSLAKEYTLIPVYREVLADLETPISVFMKLCQEEPGAFLLESVEGGEKVARYSFLGCRPLLTLAGGKSPALHGGEEVRVLEGDPLTHLRDVMNSFKVYQPAGLPRFCGGAVGYLSYDAVRHYEKLPGTPVDDQG